MYLEQPFDSKTMRIYDRSQAVIAINKYIASDDGYTPIDPKYLMGNFKNGNNKLRSVMIVGNTTALEKDIPDLPVPLVSYTDGWIAFDMRKHFTFDKNSNSYQPKKLYDTSMQYYINYLVGIWAIHSDKELYVLKLPHLAFAEWISRLLKSQFGLDLKETSAVYYTALIYYYRMFNIGNKTPNESADDIMARLNINFINKEFIQGIIEQTSTMTTIEDFCDILFNVTHNINLKDFNIKILKTLVERSWMGLDTRVMLLLSLECPSIWTALCYTALKDTSFKKTKITEAVSHVGEKGKGVEFLKSIEGLIDRFGK